MTYYDGEFYDDEETGPEPIAPRSFGLLDVAAVLVGAAGVYGLMCLADWLLGGL